MELSGPIISIFKKIKELHQVWWWNEPWCAFQPTDYSKPEKDNETGEGFGAQMLWKAIEGVVGV